LICPRCQSGRCRRSRRRGLRDYFISLVNLRPWRCRNCDLRFFGWAAPVAYAKYAHCLMCGNFDLQRISGEHVKEGMFPRLSSRLHVPAYRCDPCRNRFFSLRPYRRILPLKGEPGGDSRSAAAARAAGAGGPGAA